MSTGEGVAAAVRSRPAVRAPLQASALAGLVAAGWVFVAMVGGLAGITPAGAAAGAGAAVLAAGLLAPSGAGALPLLGHGVLVGTITVALAASDRGTVPMIVTMAVVAVVAIAVAWRTDDRLGLKLGALTGAGLIVLTVGTAAAGEAIGRPAAAVVLAGCVVGFGVCTEAARAYRPLGLLVAPFLVAGVIAAAGSSEAVVPVLGFAAAGGVAVDRAPLALGLLALAAAALPAAAPAAGLFAAAAVLAAALGRREAVVLGLPGVVAVAAVAVAVPPGVGTVALAVATGAAGATLVTRAGRRSPSSSWPPAARWANRAPALALGAWLLVAPGSWTWAGDAGLQAYDKGAAVAASAGVLAVVLAWTRRRLPVWTPPPLLTSSPPVLPPAQGAGPAVRTAVLASMLGVVASLTWLVLASLR